ncbi:hypothetical protein AAT19DRAFT_9070 [Rhodotorula toruloides]|uniref:Uncharacterized protein n=1 Tax=Rhodotorula toruloides TaxID=5286 RepID=A0A2T0AJ40_RHOTO|nr:hypothetical protein AAT19DRAFT_9070 [Rhodotorula toruloides]
MSRSPAISSISSSRTIKASLSASTSRPPVAASNPSNRHRHARSQSTTSTSSRSSALSSQSHDDHASQAATWSHARSPVASPSLPSARPPLAAVDWSASPTPAPSSPPAAPRPRLRTSSGSEGAISWSTGFVEREMDEQEKEAKVERRIADLEIRNASLLSINTSLERLKVKHTNEIRELRRKLRESIGGAGLAALRAQATKLVEADDAGGEHLDDSDDEADLNGEHENEPTWQELLDGDPTFSALAGTVEALIARAKRAVEYEPAGADVGGGRVLSTVEMEDRLRMEDGGGVEDEEEQSSGMGTSPELSRASTPATSAASSSAAVSSAEKGLGIRGWQRHMPR